MRKGYLALTYSVDDLNTFYSLPDAEQEALKQKFGAFARKVCPAAVANSWQNLPTIPTTATGHLNRTQASDYIRPLLAALETASPPSTLGLAAIMAPPAGAPRYQSGPSTVHYEVVGGAVKCIHRISLLLDGVQLASPTETSSTGFPLKAQYSLSLVYLAVSSGAPTSRVDVVSRFEAGFE